MEEKKLVICPSEVDGVISYDNVTIVHGEINVNEIKAKHEEIDSLKAQIEDFQKRIAALEEECVFADKIIEAKLAEDARLAAEAEKVVAEAAPVQEPQVEPVVEPVSEPAEPEHFEQQSMDNLF